MLAVRLQRQGRSGHAHFRLIVQDSRLSPKSGKVVARLGSFDPHSKQVIVDKQKAQHYLDHGAQPSPRVALLLKSEGVKLPKWVQLPAKQKAEIKNPEKLRKNRPADSEKPAPAEQPEPTETTAEQPAEEPKEKAQEQPEQPQEVADAEPAEKPAESPAPETPESPAEAPETVAQDSPDSDDQQS